MTTDRSREQTMTPRTTRTRPTAPAAAAALAGLVCLLLTTGCLRRIPEIRGRVLDASTGAPVEGALVARVGYHIPELILDSSSPSRVDSTQTSTRTGADGRFELDGGWMTGFNHVEWVVFEPGRMPAGGKFARWGIGAVWDTGFMGKFVSPRDDWAPWTAELRHGTVVLEVRLREPAARDAAAAPRPTPPPGVSPTPTPPWHHEPDVDPWGEHFRRLGLMVQERWIPVETFVEEAESYAAARPLTEGVAREINNMQYQLGSLREDGTYRNPREGLALVTLVAEYCRQNPETAMCKREEWMLSRSVERFRRIGGGQ